MYLLLLIIAYIIAYYGLALWFQYFFNEKKTLKYKFYHSVIIALFYFAVVLGITFIPNEIIGNRLLHAVGGGFITIIITFFSLKASQIKITKFQFIFLGFFISTTLGVLNELAESLGQNIFNYPFSTYINDTWFDLWSNTIGAIIGLLVFVGFVGKKK